MGLLHWANMGYMRRNQITTQMKADIHATRSSELLDSAPAIH